MFPVNIIHAKAEALGLDYVVIGGQAFNTFGEPRTTLDVDFLIRKEDRDPWMQLLNAEGFRLSNDGGNFLQFSPPYGVDWNLDLMLVNDSTFDKLRNTARRVTLLGVATKVPSAENLIRLKLHALKFGPEHRRGQDLADVIALIRIAKIDVRTEGFCKLIEEHGTHPKYTTESLKQRPQNEGGFEFPVEPGFRSLPPKGTWEAGYRLSLVGLEMIKDRPWIWEDRERRRCYEEFKM